MSFTPAPILPPGNFDSQIPFINRNFLSLFDTQSSLYTASTVFSVKTPIDMGTLAPNTFGFGFNAGEQSLSSVPVVDIPLRQINFDVYVDGTDITHRWPDGSALSAGAKKFFIVSFPRDSLAGIGAPDPGFRTAPHTAYINYFYNGDTVSHDYFIQYGFNGYPITSAQYG